MADEQVYQFVLFAMSELQGFEEVFRQWRDGMIDENRWQSTQYNLKWYLTWPGLVAAFELRRKGWDREFVNFVDEALSNAVSLETLSDQDWKAQVARIKAKQPQSTPAQNSAP